MNEPKDPTQQNWYPATQGTHYAGVPIKSSWIQTETPIVKDMRSTARELGIVRDLLHVRRIFHNEPTGALVLLEEALLMLGATHLELSQPKDRT